MTDKIITISIVVLCITILVTLASHIFGADHRGRTVIEPESRTIMGIPVKFGWEAWQLTDSQQAVIEQAAPDLTPQQLFASIRNYAVPQTTLQRWMSMAQPSPEATLSDHWMAEQVHGPDRWPRSMWHYSLR